MPDDIDEWGGSALVQHEYFHAVQYEYVNPLGDTAIDLALWKGNWQSVLWWVEATAIWGEMHAESTFPFDLQNSGYARHLAELLPRTHLELTTRCAAVGGPSTVRLPTDLPRQKRTNRTLPD